MDGFIRDVVAVAILQTHMICKKDFQREFQPTAFRMGGEQKKMYRIHITKDEKNITLGFINPSTYISLMKESATFFYNHTSSFAVLNLP